MHGKKRGSHAAGFKNFDKKVKVVGVILNNVAGEVHADWCRDAIEKVWVARGRVAASKHENQNARTALRLGTYQRKTRHQFIRKIVSFIQQRLTLNKSSS
jgi:cobyrinic acid a,c-diamide synthase